MIREYRISTNSWSAEYGGAAGFIANAITRAGGAAWHGNAYFNLKNDVLNANSFQNNAHLLPRSPSKEAQYGFQTGGPLWKQALFFSAGLEIYRARSYQPSEPVNVPSPLAVQQGVDPGGAAHTLLTSFPTPATAPGDGETTTLTVRPTRSLDRYLGLARADYVSGSRRLMLRVAINRSDWPDFVFPEHGNQPEGVRIVCIEYQSEADFTVHPGLNAESAYIYDHRGRLADGLFQSGHPWLTGLYGILVEPHCNAIALENFSKFASRLFVQAGVAQEHSA
jgi:hypothetical protein